MSIYSDWSVLLIWVSVIFGLLLCYRWVISSRIVLCLLHAMNHQWVIKGLYLVLVEVGSGVLCGRSMVGIQRVGFPVIVRVQRI